MTASCRIMLLVLFLFGVITSFHYSASAQVIGGHWKKQAPIPTSYSVQGVAPLSSTECWIAAAPFFGDGGELAHTTDAGRTWTVVSLGVQVTSVAFVDSLHGWAAGNAFFHTTDG